jgi:hypothetical protein
MAETTNVSSNGGFPVSATTESKQKDISSEFDKQNAAILKKIEDSETYEKDDNDIMGEQIEKQIGEKTNNNLSDAIIKMATCPCCGQFYMGNVMQCQNGHAICEECRDKLPKCAECRASYGHTKTRNGVLETLLTNMDITVPCAYRTLGCTETVPYSRIHDHWRKCQFRPAECYFGSTNGCTFKASNLGEYAEHLCMVHGAIPTDTPDADFFELNIGALASRISSSSRSAIFVHKYINDYLIINVMNMGTSYSYVLMVHSLAKNYYMFSSTIQVSNIMYMNQQEFGVQPVDMLEKMYSKKSPHFMDFFKKKMSWFSAELPYNKIVELASYPTATINCMIRNPSEPELIKFTELEANPEKPLMYNPVEDAMTQEQINTIINQDSMTDFEPHPFSQPFPNEDLNEDLEEMSSDEDN